MKKELIDRIVEREEHEHFTLKQILEEELPDFTYKIDEERMRKIYKEESMGLDSWGHSDVKLSMDQYNSTLPGGLKPLPKEMPEWFNDIDIFNEDIEIWKKIIQHYGTPQPKQPLPSVEELEKELATLWGKDIEMIQRGVAQHIHDKYSLKPREWWKDCEKFMHNGLVYKKYSHQVYPDGRTFLHSELSRYDLQNCTPYTITADEIIKKHNLTEEEVRMIREGKC